MNKVYRLSDRKVFAQITKSKKIIASKKYLIHFQKNNIKHFRFAIVVSKANFSKAVLRNKIKRQVRTFFSKIKDKELPVDILIKVNLNYLKDTYQTNYKDFEFLIKKLIYFLKGNNKD